MWLDLVLKDGFVVDGTGNVWYKADVGIKDSKITAIGNLESAKTPRRIDIKGLIVSPGFVDIHTHSDRTLLLVNRCESMIMQGVTTECVGSCGTSFWPISELNRESIFKSLNSNIGSASKIEVDWSSLGGYIQKLEDKGISINVAAQVGHGTVRSAVLGWENKAPKQRELVEMKSLVEEAMKDGAFGLSSGLDYIPGCYADTDELIELMKVAAKYGGIYSSHVRERDLDSLKKAVLEAIIIGERSGAPKTQISHMFQRGKGVECLEVIENARKRGIDVTADIHLAGILTNRRKLSSIIPVRWRKEGTEKLIEALNNPKSRKRIRDDCLMTPRKKTGVTTAGLRNLVLDGRWEEIKLVSLYQKKMLKNEEYVNLNLAEIAKLRGINPFDALFDLIIEEADNVYGSSMNTDESVRKTLIQHPAVMKATDSTCKAAALPWINTWAQSARDYGSYAYALGTWVKRDHVLSLEEMVRKMTSLPARTLGLRNRGLILKGMYADIVVFNMDTMEVKSTFKNPHQYSKGVEYVIVNGKIVIEKGRHTGKLPGRFLRHFPD
jgi:N-acyl-D-amino-acid deacylase